MKLGKLEILWPRARSRVDTSMVPKDLTGAFAISEFEPWWMAVHQALNELEMETVEAARRYTADPNKCIAAVGAGEGIAMVRMRLLEKRSNALAAKKEVLQ